MTPRPLLVAVLACAFGATLPMTSSRADTGSAPVPAVDPALLLRAADLAYKRDLDRARTKATLDRDSRQIASLRRLLQPLLIGASAMRPAARNWAWAISLETRDEPVAYCLPGGKLLVTTGLIDRVRLTSDEQSAVLAHLVAHALADDDADEAIARLERDGGAASADPNRTVVRLAGILADLVATSPHDVAGEQAADTLALELMARSGVDPRPSVEAWRKIARAGGASPPAFLAMHPPWPERIAELEAQMPAMVTLYETTLRERPPSAAPLLPPGMPRR